MKQILWHAPHNLKTLYMRWHYKLPQAPLRMSVADIPAEATIQCALDGRGEKWEAEAIAENIVKGKIENGTKKYIKPALY